MPQLEWRMFIRHFMKSVDKQLIVRKITELSSFLNLSEVSHCTVTDQYFMTECRILRRSR